MPTWFQSSLLLGCAAVLAQIAVLRANERSDDVGRWRGLAAIFLFLSIDETAQLHERSMKLLLPVLDVLSLRPSEGIRSFFRAGIFHYTWVIPAAAVVVTLLLVYLRFLLALPSPVRRLCVIAAALYVGGALGLEMAGGLYASLHGRAQPVYSLLASGEEVAEMAGALVFLCAFLSLLQSRVDADRV